MATAGSRLVQRHRPADRIFKAITAMDTQEWIFIKLFGNLRDDLREECGIGLALKAEGRDVTLRIRSQKRAGDEKRPYFAVVVGERDGAFRISYKPSGVPPAESRVTIVPGESSDELIELIRGYVEQERRRLIAYRDGE